MAQDDDYGIIQVGSKGIVYTLTDQDVCYTQNGLKAFGTDPMAVRIYVVACCGTWTK